MDEVCMPFMASVGEFFAVENSELYFDKHMAGSSTHNVPDQVIRFTRSLSHLSKEERLYFQISCWLHDEINAFNTKKLFENFVKTLCSTNPENVLLVKGSDSMAAMASASGFLSVRQMMRGGAFITVLKELKQIAINLRNNPKFDSDQRTLIDNCISSIKF